jgi:hypothetical protein
MMTSTEAGSARSPSGTSRSTCSSPTLPRSSCSIGLELAQRLDAFVERGGTLIVSGLAGLRDDQYEPRPVSPLACLGIQRLVEVRPDMRGAYFRVEPGSTFPRSGDSELVYLDGPYVHAEYSADVERHLALVPPGPFGPPERVTLGPASGEPGITTRDFGAGQAVLLPWRCGALVERDGHPTTVDLLADVLEHLAGVEPLGGNLPPMVEATVFGRRDGALVVHVVNLSGHFGGRELAPVPMRDLEVVVPFDREPAGVRALVGGSCTWSVRGRLVSLRIAELALFEVLVVDPSRD